MIDDTYVVQILLWLWFIYIYTFEYLLNFYISQCISLYIQTEAEKMLTCFYFSLNHTYIDMLNKCYILLDNLYNDEYLITAVQKIYTYFNCDISSSQLNFDDTSYLLSIVDVRFKCHLEVELLKDETFLLIFLSMPCVHMFDFSSFCSFFFSNQIEAAQHHVMHQICDWVMRERLFIYIEYYSNHLISISHKWNFSNWIKYYKNLFDQGNTNGATWLSLRCGIYIYNIKQLWYTQGEKSGSRWSLPGSAFSPLDTFLLEDDVRLVA